MPSIDRRSRQGTGEYRHHFKRVTANTLLLTNRINTPEGDSRQATSILNPKPSSHLEREVISFAFAIRSIDTPNRAVLLMIVVIGRSNFLATVCSSMCAFTSAIN